MKIDPNGVITVSAIVILMVTVLTLMVIRNSRLKAENTLNELEELKRGIKADLTEVYSGEEFTADDYDREVKSRPNSLTKEEDKSLFKDLYYNFNLEARANASTGREAFIFDLIPTVMDFIKSKNVSLSNDELQYQAELLVERVGRDYMIAKMMAYVEGLGYTTWEYDNADYLIYISPNNGER